MTTVKTFTIDDKTNWQEDLLQQRLNTLATAEKDVQWIREDLTLAESNCFTRWVFKIAKYLHIHHCLGRNFYHIDLEKSREILNKLKPQIEKDGRHIELFNRAVDNYNRIVSTTYHVMHATKNRHNDETSKEASSEINPKTLRHHEASREPSPQHILPKQERETETPPQEYDRLGDPYENFPPKPTFDPPLSIDMEKASLEECQKFLRTSSEEQRRQFFILGHWIYGEPNPNDAYRKKFEKIVAAYLAELDDKELFTTLPLFFHEPICIMSGIVKQLWGLSYEKIIDFATYAIKEDKDSFYNFVRTINRQAGTFVKKEEDTKDKYSEDIFEQIFKAMPSSVFDDVTTNYNIMSIFRFKIIDLHCIHPASCFVPHLNKDQLLALVNEINRVHQSDEWLPVYLGVVCKYL